MSEVHRFKEEDKEKESTCTRLPRKLLQMLRMQMLFSRNQRKVHDHILCSVKPKFILIYMLKFLVYCIMYCILIIYSLTTKIY